jgi:hypothetical protein
MTRVGAEKVALAAALLGILILLFAHISYLLGFWPR